MPTPPGRTFSFVIEYTVNDLSGNAAPAARRLVRVVCPPPEAYCADPESGAPTCTVGGVCGQPAALKSLAAAAAGGRGAAAAAAAGAAAPPPGAAAQSSAAVAAAARRAPPAAPVISLQGPPVVEINAGAPYDRCAPSAPLGAACDRGAAAFDSLDGPLDRVVTVCGNAWAAAGGRRLAPVLLACGIDGGAPGEHNLTFTATNSAGLSSAVSRRLVIRARCPAGEVLCPDRLRCSEGGTCVSSLAAASGGGGGAQGAKAPSASTAAAQQAAAKANSDAASAVAARINAPPTISLRTGNELGASVFVRRVFGSYAACGKGESPSADAPCELGADASDPDGGAGGGELDLSGSVVACPPPECLQPSGCPPGQLRRHFFRNKARWWWCSWCLLRAARRARAPPLPRPAVRAAHPTPSNPAPRPQGLAGCPIDLMAAEGTPFAVSFWVWDAGSPPLNASVERTVTLSKACPADAAPHLCQQDGGKHFCSGGFGA